MKKCIKCGSHAFNLYAEGIDQGGLCDVHYWQGRAHRAEALAQTEQEPLAKVVSTAPDRIWLDLGFDPQDEYDVIFHELHDVTWSQDNASGNGIEYVRADTTPPKRPWVGLTDAEMQALWDRYAHMEMMRAIETQLKRKNT